MNIHRRRIPRRGFLQLMLDSALVILNSDVIAWRASEANSNVTKLCIDIIMIPSLIIRHLKLVFAAIQKVVSSVQRRSSSFVTAK